VRNLRAALSAVLEFPKWGKKWSRAGPIGRNLAAVGIQPRLGIKRVQMRNAAGHVHEDHALRASGKLRWFRCQWINRSDGPARLIAQYRLQDTRQQQTRPGRQGSQQGAT